MKKIFKIVYIVIFVYVIVFLFTFCSSGNVLPKEVCNYTSIACELNLYLCNENIIPENVCYWSNLICEDITYLCDTNIIDKTESIIKLKNDMLNYNKSIKAFLDGKK